MTAADATAVVLVTGVSGSGKSAIARRLTAMGRDAISMDADEQLTAGTTRPPVYAQSSQIPVARSLMP